ncbi:GntR family transcriptional regulator [Pseudoduganella namucuonensis]|uniref:DNA-binding transcriptional regulator, GntR family n=1 Tax=Pseudoduganella namucuonensis TaxID=1035707 RepID=A0A1I7LPQ2_9BURK|nr:GntR family transcriptional regulator [Pseudoduganella namucuonensis]SFV11656.1 DNA-binding transcriptional regulator, GntR family [Pseudoduganella namucuonensis]
MSVDSLPGIFQLDRTRNATVQVFEHLRELIVTLAIKPGTVLPRGQLADYFNLSLTPIREALARLEEERLVDIYPQHQTRVGSIDLASARQAHFFRLSVELEIAHVLAERANPALAKRLLDILGRQRACLDSGDLENFTRVDLEFHQTMYNEVQLPALWTMMRSSSGNLDRLRRLHLPVNGKAQSILEQHTQIALCIGEGDAVKAQACVRRHLSGTLVVLNALKDKYPDNVLPEDYTPVAFPA